MADDDDKEEPAKAFTLDAAQQGQFCEFFRALPVATDTLRFFWRNGYYSVHGPDCEHVAREYIRTEQCIKPLGPASNPLPSCFVNAKLFHEIVNDLWTRTRLEVWEQRGRGWERTRRCSPGHTVDFDDLLEKQTDAAVVVAVQLHEAAGQVRVGCAYCNGTRRQLGVGEFLDGDPLTNLEALLVQLGAKECLLPLTPAKGPTPLMATAAAVLERLGVVRTEVPSADFAPRKEEDPWVAVRGLLREGTAMSADLPAVGAMGPLAALLRFLRRTADDTEAAGQFTIHKVDLQRYMRLDATAVRALHLFPSGDGGGGGSPHGPGGSLFGLLNRCRTPMGGRLLRQWVAQPLRDVAEILKRQDLIEAFMTDELLQRTVRDDVLRKVPDLDLLVRKFLTKRARIADTVALSRALAAVPPLQAALGAHRGPHAALLQVEFVEPLAEVCGHVEGLQRLIATTLDASDPSAVVIAPSFDEELQDLATRRGALDQQVDRVYRKALQDLGMDPKTLKLERSPAAGCSLRVSRQKDAAVRGRPSAYTVLETRKDGVRFTTPELQGLNTTRRDLQAAYETRQAAIETKLQETVATYLPLVEDVREYVTVLDVLAALAEASGQASVPYTRPTVLPAAGGALDFVGARHPLLEAREGSSVVPNDVRLGGAAPLLQLITGPNMGGKSTYLRTAALLQLMAQMGMCLPCRSATVSVRDSILARVGAGDYQSRGVSTFMAEMVETATLLRTASPDSLIIIDELGRGTSTDDGFGLAWAIAAHIATELRAFCLFATHFHELTALPSGCPRVGNLHVDATTATGKLVLLYAVLPGPSSQSFGIHVAELARFPDAVVAAAKRKAAELETFDPPATAKRHHSNGTPVGVPDGG